MSGAAFWAVIPAAGIGSRVGAAVPKQYLTINDKAIIEYAIQPFCEHAAINGVVVVTAANDTHWQTLTVAGQAGIERTDGGKERCHSVLNGLHSLRQQAAADDWVLVHDAVRPCLRATDIDKLIQALDEHPVGGSLAMPVRDTMKRSNAKAEVTATVERQHLWHALTPQMFRLGKLEAALQAALDKGVSVTDETQAMELSGLTAKLVPCGAHNIKITRAEDLALAEFYLAGQS
ncbi:MAG: 2-C-methyl-D-erythritol 4-phosphate cytidylyltransferase [Gammaproteobacteria bacterium]